MHIDLSGQRLVGIAVVAMSLASMGLVINSAHETSQTNDRLCRYLVKSSEVTKVRAALNEERYAAVDDYVLGQAEVFAEARRLQEEAGEVDEEKTPAQTELAIRFYALQDDYVAETQRIKEDRLNNPPPELPDNCEAKF